MNNYINRDLLQQFVADDQDMLDDLASVYARLTPSDVERLQGASHDGDCVQTAKLAEQLKNRFSCFSAGPLAEIAAELQDLAEQEDLAGADPLVKSVCDGALALIEELSELTGQADPESLD